ncbi:hypothetical protein MKZ38_005213 [Zalerion maritima]|uniref:Sister chromatid cohesion protein n=1 Tax=Zalerion maritima TaxID=339359 RepID=A0AAD5RLJ4_9PEZI|nr:hypothetical protein MKZ38_005213 [Zalerion maritima]
MANQRPTNNLSQHGSYSNGSGMSSASSSSQNLQPYSLNEALPYSPFTSILPFNSNIIPTPTLGSGSATPLSNFVSTDDFTALNAEATSANHSRRLEHSLEQIQHLLNPSRITQFKFKTASRPSRQSQATSSALPFSDELSPFSRLVYSKSAIAYRYPSPEAEPVPPKPKPKARPKPKANGKPKPPIVKQESPSFLPADIPEAPPEITSVPAPLQPARNSYHTARLEINLPSASLSADSPESIVAKKKASKRLPSKSPPSEMKKAGPKPVGPSPTKVTPIPAPQIPPVSQQLTPKSTEPKPKETSLRLEVNLPMPSINVDEYVEVPDILDVPEHLSSKRDELDERDALGEGLDLGQRSERALKELRKCFQEIFRCESLMRAQQQAPPNIVAWTADEQLTLTPGSLKKARALMQAAIDLKCFSSVPADELVRIQRLCDRGLKHGDNYDIRLNTSSWGESDILAWVQQLPEVELALKAARTTLCVMSGGRQDKRLYSEDIIQQCLHLFRNLLEGVIIPLAEMRSSAPMFRLLNPHKKAILSLLTNGEKLLSMMARLMSSIELSDIVVNSLEDCSSRLIFVENAHAEKDSVVSVQKFDSLRLVAMDLLCQVFQKNPTQRVGILTSILTSLEKLPLGKSSARHFKLTDGGNIQPVSALIMRLVQASAGFVDENAGKYGGHAPVGEGESDEEDNAMGIASKFSFTTKSENQAALNPLAAIDELQSVVNYLYNSYHETATYVCNFLIARAKQSNKTGDSPYRNLLEMFVEDFTTCLDNPSWPAASILLRVMLHLSLNIVQGDKAPSGTKSSVSAINMALELMGIMGATMARIRSNVQKTSSPFDDSESDDLWHFLSDLADSVLEDRASLELMTEWSGPYRAVLEFLDQRCSTDPHLGSAISYVVLDWAKNTLQACKESAGSEERFAPLAYRLRMMIMNRQWLASEFSFAHVSSSHAKLSYAITIINSELYTLYRPILHIFFQSMSRDEVTVRSKSLKSITHLIETDPTILDGKADIYHKILEDGLGDPSPQVRESALGLISTCLALRPQYEGVTRPAVLERLTDTSIGVRKRSMKLSRDLYLRSHDQQIRTEICGKLLIRLQDQEDSVRELARQLVEEIWITPFAHVAPSGAAQTSMSNHVALVIRALNSARDIVGENVILTLVKGIIGSESKTDSASLKVCERLVSGMFNLVPNSASDDPNVPSGPEALQVLVFFAKVAQSLFTFEQIRSLRPYIETIPQLEDPATSVAALHIYRRVVPTLSTVHKQFLGETRKQLQQFLLKGINAQVLDEMIACLWAISRLLSTTLPMASLVASSLRGALKTSQTPSWTPASLSSFARYCLIVGTSTKYGEGELESFKEVFAKMFGRAPPSTISKFIVDALVSLASPSSTRPKEVRKASLEAVAMVCQSNPKNYVAPNVYTTFQEAFKERNQLLEALVLNSILAFLSGEEKRTAESGDAKSRKEAKRELTVMGGTSYDDVASATTQRFLQDATRIALQDVSPHSKLALEVLGSINRQGLVHPKETGVTFITLETCPSQVISDLAFKEHKLLHDKHEQVLEREYAKAIQSAYNYQRDVVDDPRGARLKPDGSYEPKLLLMMEVLKISRSKNRQKFLEKLVRLVDFDVTKFKVTDNKPQHVHLSRFVLENLAFFEYITLGEVISAVSAMEKIFYTTGSSLAQTIESDIFQVRMDAVAPHMEEGEVLAVPPMDTKKLRLLAAASMVLSCLYEARTYIRRLWGLGTHKRDKTKMQAKDLSKAPLRVQGVTGEKFWEDMEKIMESLDGEDQMMAQCRRFVELMTVDSEVKVGEEEEEDGKGEGGAGGTPSGDEEEGGAGPAPGRGRKRKAGSAVTGGRKKRARSNSKPRPRGRPRKLPRPEEEEMAVGDDMEWV